MGPGDGGYGSSGLTAYEIYKVIHVLAAMAWFGAGIATHLLLARARNSKDARLMASMARASVFMGRALFTPLSLVTLLSGILMVAVAPHIRFGDFWILLGYGGIVVSAGLAMSVIGPSSRKLAELIQERGTVDAEVKGASRKGRIAARIDLLVLTAVVWAMVTKPVL